VGLVCADGSSGLSMLGFGCCGVWSEGIGGLAVLSATSRKFRNARIFSTASSLASSRSSIWSSASCLSAAVV